jgi:hypothetical protein
MWSQLCMQFNGALANKELLWDEKENLGICGG